MDKQLDEQIFGIMHFVMIFPDGFIEINHDELDVVEVTGRLFLTHNVTQNMNYYRE